MALASCSRTRDKRTGMPGVSDSGKQGPRQMDEPLSRGLHPAVRGKKDTTVED